MAQNQQANQIYFTIIKALIGISVHPLKLILGWVCFISLMGYFTGYAGLSWAAMQSELPMGQAILYDAFVLDVVILCRVIWIQFRRQIKTSTFQIKWAQFVDLHAQHKMKINGASSANMDAMYLSGIMFTLLFFAAVIPFDQILADVVGINSTLIIWFIVLLSSFVLHYGILFLTLRLLAVKDIAKQLQILKEKDQLQQWKELLKNAKLT